MVDDQQNQPVNFELLFESEKKRSEEYLTRLKYLQADFENLKKRFDRETEQIRKHCTENLVIQLIDVVDELELAIKTGKSSENAQKSLLEGVEMTLKKLRKVLEQEGVSQINCLEGEVFDPSLHNAVATEERDNVKACVIIEEIRKGYKMKDRVIRPAIVKVAVNNTQSNKNGGK